MVTTKNLVCAFLISIYVSSMQPIDVIIDLELLVEPDKMAAVSELGMFRLTKAFFFGIDVLHLQKKFLDTLNKIPSQYGQKRSGLYWEGREAPGPIYDWVLGTEPSSRLLARTKQNIKNQKKLSSSEKDLMVTLAEITFDPSKNSSVMRLVSGGVALIEKLRRHGHTVHILANWNQEAWERLRKKFHSDFQRLINGTIMTSGQEHITKSPHLYEQFFTKSGVDPRTCIVIEIDHHYADEFKQYAKNNDMHVRSIICKDRNFKTAYQYFDQHNIWHQPRLKPLT